MQISLSHPSDTSAKLTVVASPEEMATVKQGVLERLQNKVKLPGFRAGKAPLAMVEKSVDQEQLQSEFLDDAVNQMCMQAIGQKRLRIVTTPQVNITKFVPFTTLEFEADMDIIGEIKLPDYKKHKKAKAPVKVTAEDVNGVLDQLRTRQAVKKPVERAAKDGDEVVIDFKGVDEKGEAISGAEGQDYPLALGSNTFIPGFEDNVVGMKAGEDKTFDLKFPKDYGVAALASKKVTFTVTAKTVNEQELPKADDAFAATVGPFKALTELKDDIKKQLQLEKQNQADRQYEDELVQELAAKTKAPLPKALVDDQIARMEQEERQNLAYRGQTWQEHLDAEGVTEEQHREQKRPQAEVRVKVGVMLSEIAEAEGLSVSDDELEVRLNLLRGQYTDKQMQAELAKPENRRDVAGRILTEKTLEILVGYAG